VSKVYLATQIGVIKARDAAGTVKMEIAMTTEPRALRPVMPILLGAAVMLSLSMGIRQSFGLFLQPVTKDLALTVSEFTIALSIQNLTWGILQPVAGALVGRLGFRPILVGGAALYLAGLATLAGAQGMIGLVLGAGLLIGISLACTASAMAQAAASRAVSASARSMVLGVITGVGSLGALAAAPIGQSVTAAFGWRFGVLGILALASLLLPAAWFASRVDRMDLPRSTGGQTDDVTVANAVRSALTRPSFVVMASAYFVCGMQLLFISTHLPSYLAICGMDPTLSAEALSVIAIFNVFGSVFFGWAGGHWPKLVLLGGIYVARSLVLGLYFVAPPTPLGTLVFAAFMGFLWLGVGPLVAGSVVEMFGLRWQAMIQGLAFMSHQLGSFVGAFGGGVLFDMVGSYDVAWRLGVAMGLTAGVAQIAFAIARPTRFAPA
jgi:predicted MFS family arabinose efflux permease